MGGQEEGQKQTQNRPEGDVEIRRAALEHNSGTMRVILNILIQPLTFAVSVVAYLW